MKTKTIKIILALFVFLFFFVFGYLSTNNKQIQYEINNSSVSTQLILTNNL